jgi:hypothetical protein
MGTGRGHSASMARRSMTRPTTASAETR